MTRLTLTGKIMYGVGISMWIFLLFILGLAISQNGLDVFGQDIDPCGASNLDMYKRLCDQKEIYKIYNEILDRTGQTLCFDDKDNYLKYKQEYENKTDYKVIYPCAPLDFSKIPEDESGK